MTNEIPTVIQCPFDYELQQYDENIFFFYFTVPHEFENMHIFHASEDDEYVGFEILYHNDELDEVFLHSPYFMFDIEFFKVDKRTVTAMITKGDCLFDLEILESYDSADLTSDTDYV